MKKSTAKISVREIALFGVLGALTFAAKLVMSGLPNIEPVSLMVMLCVVRLHSPQRAELLSVDPTLSMAFSTANPVLLCLAAIWRRKCLRTMTLM